MRKAIVLFIILSAFSVCSGDIITVDDDGPADFNNIQAAIDIANTGDIIIVQPGTYVGDGNHDIDFLGKAITVRSIDPNNPNIVADTVIDCNGSEIEPHRAFYFHSDETADSVVDGLTIVNGYSPPEQYENQTYTFWGGGAILCYNSSPTISNCCFLNNQAAHYGGAVYCSDSDSLISRCIFTNNVAHTGGAISCRSGSPVVENCIIRNNEAVGYVEGWGRNLGGGIYSIYGLTIINNCRITGNFAESAGGGVCTQDVDSMITNCTIFGNTSPLGGAIYCGELSYPSIDNCILWGNEAINGPEIAMCSMDWGSWLSVSYSNVQGGQAAIYDKDILDWGEGNIDVDPLFADADANDFHLQSQAGRWDANSQSWVKDANTSPCIDAGDPNSDWTLELWPHGQRINMGAYGGTPQGSMSLSTAGNIADLDNDGDVDYNDLKLFTGKWPIEQVLLAEDLDRNGEVNFKDYAIFGREWFNESLGEPPMTYEITQCGGGILAVGLDQTRFTVTVEGNYIHFEDIMKANCCATELWLEMYVYEDEIIIYEKEYGGYCYCICHYPIEADIGPFESGTYTLGVYEDYGGLIGTTTVIIE